MTPPRLQPDRKMVDASWRIIAIVLGSVGAPVALAGGSLLLHTSQELASHEASGHDVTIRAFEEVKARLTRMEEKLNDVREDVAALRGSSHPRPPADPPE